MSMISLRGCGLLFVMLLGPLGNYSVAESREKSSPVLYADGGIWSVFMDKPDGTCSVTLSFDHKGIVFSSSYAGGPARGYIAFVDDALMPTRAAYNFEIRNEASFSLSAKAHAYEAGGYGYWQIDGLTHELVSNLVRSGALYVKSDGTRPAHYDLNGFRKGFLRFADCLKALENRKAPAAQTPRVRRMN